MSEALYEYLESLVGAENILLYEPMSNHTTFKVGGPAKYFVTVSTIEQLVKIIKCLRQMERDFFILGNGSNILVGDKGYDGVMITFGESLSKVDVLGQKVIAYAGASLAMVAKSAAKEGLQGMEFASGIPGTIGGAIVMNAGAYGGEMKQVITKVTVVTYDGEILEIDNDAMEFGYRTSAIKKRPFVVVSAELLLQKGNVEEIQAKMSELNSRRREKQPLEYPSAGSTFKRPEGNFAGKLIMEAGLGGFRVGGAQISEKHCGFVINRDHATAEDIKILMQTVKETVNDKFNVTLEPEIIMVGQF